jgi:hypothetical protein
LHLIGRDSAQALRLMSTDPALASGNAREPESLDKVTNPLVLLVAGEIQLPTILATSAARDASSELRFATRPVSPKPRFRC